VNARARRAHELQYGRECDGLRERGDPRQAEPGGDLPVVRNAAARKIPVLRPQPHRDAEGRSVLQGAPQHLRVGKRRVGLGERDAPSVSQHRHLGEPLAGELPGEGTQRIDVCEIQTFRAVLEHFHKARFIERRVGVGGTGEARDAARDRGLHFRCERRLVFEARFAQPRG